MLIKIDVDDVYEVIFVLFLNEQVLQGQGSEWHWQVWLFRGILRF